MTPFDFHTFRDWDARLGRFVWFAGEPTPTEAPKRAVEGAADTDDRALDHRLAEMQQRLHEWNAELSSGNDLSADNPFKGLGPDLIPTAQRLLDEAYRELSTQHEQDLEAALTNFRENLGPAHQDLSNTLLLAADSWGLLPSPPPRTELEDALASMPPQEPLLAPSASAGPATESVAEAGGLYTVESGDNMYEILTKRLSADPELKQHTAIYYGLNKDLSPSDFAIQLFQKVPRLKQDHIYPGDTVLFKNRGDIFYLPKLQSSTPPPAPRQPEEPSAVPASDAVAAGSADSGGDGLAQVDDGVSAGEEGGEADPDRDQNDSATPLLEDNASGVTTAPAIEAISVDTPGELESTIAESEKLGDLTVNYGEGVHELLYRYGIADGKLQFKELASNLYSLDPNTFPKGTACGTDAVMLAPQYLSSLNITSTEFKTLTITKVTDNQLRIEGSIGDGKRSISFLVHLPKLIENRREQAVEAALGEFVEAEINPEDIQVKHDADPADPNLNRVSITLNKIVIRGRIYGGFNAKASAPDAEQAQKQAATDLRNQVKTLYDKTIKAQHEATLAILPADFPALKDYIQQHPEIYDLSFEQNPLPGDASGTVGVEMKLSFKIHGIPTNFSISKERGPNLAEAIRRSQKTLMETLIKYDTGPLEAEAIHPRTVAPSTAAKAVDTRKTELLPVTPSEQYAYFRDSITERTDGSVEFKFFHPVASLNTGAPCKGLLKPDGTLHIIGPTGLDVSFQVSYTARQNGTDVGQSFGQVRLIKTRSGSYGGGAEPRSYKEFMKEPIKPWVDKVADSKGNFVRADLVIGDGFLYDVVRDALAKPSRQPDGTERPDPKTFLGKYRVSNDSPAAPRSAALPSGTNYLWIKPIEKRL